ncbi:DNA polymerase III gamma subunit /DNA polymerase III tau subunit [Onishia taeanensis]|uniref:DNA polymerase III subunit gamma/tau n=1 Tax=Onishia taeanensis TaxID=284577 RepID=A0A328XWR2_9GAMM|nr:DNA polymerase III subunit gamma/tau [Halomonas taeanensis]RAR64710.1 DNA polymerase III gamma subunit /DNA polymerase III tau subunit [Halomonas taeanensis]
MSYQVLARKWRPRTFHELVGQEHVQRALVNALDQGRLHHAYLFTGTRGVGKTTLARILAKCLNCTANGEDDSGVTSTPCGQCENCRAIDDGRFVDLIEVDAASRTKVEDTRELLDNVQYAPTQGRYKVYLIDEVHMLSTHSFNALLKTLEEPPPHVKFLLATTDPQKLPVTVLSRCLQFTLKNMPPERIVEHLSRVLEVENVPFDESALWLLGKAADGSMRDAMSLTDQAIAFGQGKVHQVDVAAMLGTLDQRHVLTLLEALAEVDAARVLGEVAALAEQGPDFAGVLDDLLGVLHRLAVAQMVPGALDNGHGDREVLLTLASRFTAEDVQLYYQIGLQGRGDMDQAPEPRTALEMTLLRMLAFRPQGVPKPAQTPLPMTGDAVPEQSSGKPAGQASEKAPKQAAQPAPQVPPQTPAQGAASAPGDDQREPSSPTPTPASQPAPESAEPTAQADPRPASEQPPPWEALPDDMTSTPETPAESAMEGGEDSSGHGSGHDPEHGSGHDPEHGSGHDPERMPEDSPGNRSDNGFEQSDMDAAPAPLEASAQPSHVPEPASDAPSMAPDTASSMAPDTAPAATAPSMAPDTAPAAAAEAPSDAVPSIEAETPPAPANAQAAADTDAILDQAAWLGLFEQLGLGGLTRNLAAHCVVERDDGRALVLRLAPSQAAMNAEVHVTRIQKALAGVGVKRAVSIEVGEIPEAVETPRGQSERINAERHAVAVEALRADPHIQKLQSAFGARLVEDSVEPHQNHDSA